MSREADELAERVRVARQVLELARAAECRVAADEAFRRADELYRLREYVGALQAAATIARTFSELKSSAQIFQASLQETHARGEFLVTEATASEDGWRWPVRIMRAGWAAGSVEEMGSGQKIATPHYFPQEIVARVAEAANGTRFRRKHPSSNDGNDQPELTAGWLSGGRMKGSAAVAKVNLLQSAGDVRAVLLAAREAGKLDLFGVSIFAYFAFTNSQIDGKPAIVATKLAKFVALDLVAEPGADGRFLRAEGD